jgi:hypothetical protein
MSGGGISSNVVLDAQAALLQDAVNDQPLVGEAVGHGDRLAAQVLDPADGRVLVDHHGGAVAVAEVDDLDRHALFAQRHRHRRQDERPLQMLR